jgi:phosphomannomutase
MAEENRSISAIQSDLNQYFIVKDKIPVAGVNAEHIFAYYKKKFSEYQLNEMDGLKIDFPDHWIHLRKSNTEPIIRIMVEASAEEQAKNIVNEIKKEISQLSESEGK